MEPTFTYGDATVYLSDLQAMVAYSATYQHRFRELHKRLLGAVSKQERLLEDNTSDFAISIWTPLGPEANAAFWDLVRFRAEIVRIREESVELATTASQQDAA